MSLKNYFAFLLAGMVALPATAQLSARRAGAVVRTDRPAIVRAVLEAQAAERMTDASAKTTAMVQRMISDVTYDSTSGARDSFRYFYFTPVRGAAHSPKNTASYYPFDFSPTDIYDSTSAYGNYRTQYIKFDSARRYDFSPAGVLTGSEMLVRNSYDASNRLTQMEHYEDGPATPTRRYTLSYNAAGDPTFKNYFEQGQASTLVLHSNQTSVYNPQHRPTKDSTFSVANTNAPASRFLYTYDAAGRLAMHTTENWSGSAWQMLSRTGFSYNAAGLLISSTSEEYDGSVWTPEYKDSFVYAGSNPSFTANYSYDWNAGANSWEPLFRTLNHLNAAGNWDTLTNSYYESQTSSWNLLARTTVTYNSYNNWETVTDAFDDDENDVINAGEVYGTTRYYYELWDNTASIEKLPRSTSFFIYPNPTATTLSVNWEETQTPAFYALADVHGRVVSSGTIPAGTPRLTLDLSSHAPGMFLLSISSSDGTVLHREKVVRQ